MGDVGIISLVLKESGLYFHVDLAFHPSVLFHKLCDFGLLAHPLRTSDASRRQQLYLLEKNELTFIDSLPCAGGFTYKRLFDLYTSRGGCCVIFIL